MWPAHCIFAILSFITLSFGLVTVDTPVNAAACQPVQLTWEGGTGPWQLSILDAAPPNPALEHLGGTTTGPPFTWVVDILPVGTSVIFVVQDSLLDTGQSTPFVIQQGTALGGHCPVGGIAGGQGQASGGGGIPNSGGSGTTSTGSGSGGSGSDPSSGTDPGSTGSSSSSSPGGSNGSNDTTAASQPSVPDSSSAPSKPASSPPPNVNLLSSSSSTTTTTSTSTTTSTFSTITTSATRSDSTSNSASGSSTSDPALGPGSGIHFIPGSTTGGEVGKTPSTTAILPSDSVSSTGTGQSAGSNSSFSKKNVMTGSIIGGVIAAVLCALLAAFCLIRRYRRRRLEEPDRLVYPFSISSTSESSGPREMVGRSGYPASTFSSWGNHGDLADERALSPATSPTSPVTSAEGRPWEAGQGTIESRYAATFTPGHTASSSSIDRNDPTRNDPTSQRRYRGPIPKNMRDAFRPGPADSSSLAILGDQSYSARPEDATPVPVFDEIRPQEMPSWGRMHDVMAGRHPVVVGYPPPYTSR